MNDQFDEFKRLLQVGRRYLDGKCTIHELNGHAVDCAEAARMRAAHPAIQEAARAWVDMIDRRWNEWGHRSDAILEEEFRGWLSRQLIP